MSALEPTATDHVGYVVGDLDGAQRRQEDLGFELLGRVELTPLGVEVAMLASGGQKVELVRLLDPEVDARRRGDAATRLDHVAYRVADLDAATAALVAAGAELVGPDDTPLEQPVELAGTRHVWASLGDQRLQLLQ
jgi:catechol 2,3-dioxygenase-like lactoylglutathione lyase family enzyme